jgi:uncharacterized glyoxalase superfamily protein PhnB
MNNRSIPAVTVIPVLAYADVAAAVEWLCRVFGFEERLRIADHRAQLDVGDGAVVVTDGGEAEAGRDHSIMVRIADMDAHFARVREFARVIRPPADHPYGERQYTVKDPGGHVWTFLQTIADVDPRDWGGVVPGRPATD